MTEEDKQLLNTFEARLRHFMFLHEELKEHNSKLETILSEKEDEIESLKQKCKHLETQYTNLKMVRTLSIYDNDIKDTKKRLSDLVREVDKCIALLNQ